MSDISRKALDKQKLLERARLLNFIGYDLEHLLGDFLKEIESGAFDLPSTESEGEAALRAEIERITKIANEGGYFTAYWKKHEEFKKLQAENERLKSLSSYREDAETAVQTEKYEKLRELLQAHGKTHDETKREYHRGAYNAIIDTLNHLGIEIKGVNVTESPHEWKMDAKRSEQVCTKCGGTYWTVNGGWDSECPGIKDGRDTNETT